MSTRRSAAAAAASTPAEAQAPKEIREVKEVKEAKEPPPPREAKEVPPPREPKDPGSSRKRAREPEEGKKPPLALPISTVVGQHAMGCADGLVARATFRGPTGIAIAPTSGALYVCDADNRRIRKVAW